MSLELLIAAVLVVVGATTPERIDEVREIVEAANDASISSGYANTRLAALAVKESGARVDVVGHRGECGATQVMGWFLRPAMRCRELQSPQGGYVGTLRALEQWRVYTRGKNIVRHDIEWDCYAAGQSCVNYSRPGMATRRLYRQESRLLATGVALQTNAVAAALASVPHRRHGS